MSEYFNKLKDIVLDMGLVIERIDAEDEIVVVSDEERGISHLFIDIEEPLVIIEQHIMGIQKENGTLFKRLLQMNREMVHGSFVLDAEASNIFFRDTLEVKSLAAHDLERTINALSLTLAENAAELLHLAGK